MKTDKYKDLKIGDRYALDEYTKDVYDDLQTIKYVLEALIDEVACESMLPDTKLALRNLLRDKLDET